MVAKAGPKIFAFPGRTTLGPKCGRTRTEADEWPARCAEDAAEHRP